MKEQFVEKTFSERSLAVIAQVDAIINRYLAQGYDLTVRQIHYQFVSRNLYRNTQQNYHNLAALIANARMAGLLDWGGVKDRGRVTHQRDTWDNVKQFIQRLTDHYRLDKWSKQPNHVEVMVEKQALEGVLQPVCEKWEVPFTANKGYSSATSLYERGKALQALRTLQKKAVHVIYLGDHDPSGIDMSRDVQERLELFSQGPVHLVRVALNIEQVRRFSLPENPAKQTDSRAEGYIREFGDASWELDAIEPATLANLVEDAITGLIDLRAWKADETTEDRDKELLQDITDSIGAPAGGATR